MCDQSRRTQGTARDQDLVRREGLNSTRTQRPSLHERLRLVFPELQCDVAAHVLNASALYQFIQSVRRRVHQRVRTSGHAKSARYARGALQGETGLTGEDTLTTDLYPVALVITQDPIGALAKRGQGIGRTPEREVLRDIFHLGRIGNCTENRAVVGFQLTSAE